MSVDRKQRKQDPAATTLNGTIPDAARRTVIRSFRSKPAQHVAVFVACAFMLSLLSYAASWVVDAYCDIRDRLNETESELDQVESEAEQAGGDVEEVKVATEDASAIQDARIDVLEMELGQLQLELERIRGGDTAVDDALRKVGDLAIEARKQQTPQPRSEAVESDGVVRFGKE